MHVAKSLTSTPDTSSSWFLTVPNVPQGACCPWSRTTVPKCLYFILMIFPYFHFPHPLELLYGSPHIAVLLYECEPVDVRCEFGPHFLPCWLPLVLSPQDSSPAPVDSLVTLLLQVPSCSKCSGDASFSY